MAERTLLALFPDIEPTAAAIERLHELGLKDEQVEVISGVPVTERILGRPRQWTNVTRLALGGAVVGFLTAGFLNFGTPQMYAVPVGGQPLLPIPPGLIMFFELTMLFMLLATFLGVFLDSYFPNYRPLHYVAEISDGMFGVFFECPAGEESRFTNAMRQLGAESVKPAEAIHL